MERYHDVVGQLISYFKRRINLYAVVILIFSYHFLFEKDLPCTCRDLTRDCTLCLLLLCVFAFVQCDYCKLYVAHLSFIDGDWSVCCSDHSHHNISCKNESQWTDEERAIVRGIKDKFRIIGLFGLFGLFTFAFLASCVHNNSKQMREGDWLQIVLEEEEKTVSDELSKKAKEQMKEKLAILMNGRELANYFTVGDEVIREPDPEPQPGPNPEPQPEPDPEPQPGPHPEPQPEPHPEPQPEPDPEPPSESISGSVHIPIPNSSTDSSSETPSVHSSDSDTSSSEPPSEISSDTTPLIDKKKE
ncbi:hypothetical protein WMY93_025596 [Mugilogobius chulae]|uniref:Uncharacterized protein n=1 Tax=Mugilogobius chulae TaxID=88201 RepID=A0AAW0MZC2_9GOBI